MPDELGAGRSSSCASSCPGAPRDLHVIHHLFCKTCGVGSFARGMGPDGKEMAAVNVHCIDDVDLSKLRVDKLDGRSL